MAEIARLRTKRLCPSAELAERGEGYRFVIEQGDRSWPAFAIRYEGEAFAYINRCAHIGVELDWQHGRFFDAEGRLLICSTHGALYDPRSGLCVDGPCRGKALEKVSLRETEGFIHYAY